MQLIAIILLLVSGFVLGVFSLLGYMVWRMMKNDDWDDSNMMNALRLLSHVVLHPTDFSKLFYIPEPAWAVLRKYNYQAGRDIKQPFWYVDKDEFEGVVRSRP